MILLVIACNFCPARASEEEVEVWNGTDEVYAWLRYQAQQMGWIEINNGPGWYCPECQRITKSASLSPPIHHPQAIP